MKSQLGEAVLSMHKVYASAKGPGSWVFFYANQICASQ